MTTERRCMTRRRPGEISYFEFEGGSRGIVLDASEKGLAFQAADAVQQLGSRKIFISLHPGGRIELNAEVVWMDGSKKSGGLRFVDPDADSCDRIRDWLKKMVEPGVSQHGQEYPPPAGAVEEASSIPRGTSNPDMSAIPLPPQIEAHEQLVEPSLAPILPPLFNPDLTWPSQDSSAVRRGFLHHIATGFLIAVLVLACAALAGNFGFVGRFRPKLGNALIRLGEKLNGTADPQSRVSSPSPGLAQVPTEPPSPVKSIPEASQPEAPASSDQVNSSTPNHSETPSLAIPRAKQDADHSPTSSLAKKRSVGANRLWSAVRAGNSAAEVDLARLYLKGEGVPRNCEQAKILLRAAAKNASREAREQLQKLRAYGCR